MWSASVAQVARYVLQPDDPASVPSALNMAVITVSATTLTTASLLKPVRCHEESLSVVGTAWNSSRTLFPERISRVDPAIEYESADSSASRNACSWSITASRHAISVVAISPSLIDVPDASNGPKKLLQLPSPLTRSSSKRM